MSVIEKKSDDPWCDVVEIPISLILWNGMSQTGFTLVLVFFCVLMIALIPALLVNLPDQVQVRTHRHKFEQYGSEV